MFLLLLNFYFRRTNINSKSEPKSIQYNLKSDIWCQHFETHKIKRRPLASKFEVFRFNVTLEGAMRRANIQTSRALASRLSQSLLLAFERRKVLRSIFGAVYENEAYRRAQAGIF